MILRPPRSTLFPTRRSSDLSPAAPVPANPSASTPSSRRCSTSSARTSFRSEEHTSELQSLTNLVCRLLLEKKKEKQTLHHMERVFQLRIVRDEQYFTTAWHQ